MKKIFFALIFCFPVFVFAQCKDSLCTPTSYPMGCPPDYNPICGCDGKTYRNDCVATVGACISVGWYQSGPCDEFDVDLYPNMVSADPGSVPQLRIYMKNPGTAVVDIFGSMGNQVFERYWTADQPNALIGGVDPYYLKEAQTYPMDVYIVMVTVNGHPKTVKFIKVDHAK